MDDEAREFIRDLRIDQGLPDLTTEKMRDFIETSRQQYNEDPNFSGVVNSAYIADDPAEFVIDPYIVKGTYNLLLADAGIGKTNLVCKIAALLSVGQDLFGNKVSEPQATLVVSNEDRPGLIRERFLINDGDERYFHQYINPSSIILSQSHTLKKLEDAINILRPALVVLDPLQQFVGDRDMNSMTAVRTALSVTTTIARKYNCAFLIIAHNAKRQTGYRRGIKDRYLGSTDIFAGTRSAMSVVVDEDTDERIVFHTKHNETEAGQPFAFKLHDQGRDAQGNRIQPTVEILGKRSITEREFEQKERKWDLGRVEDPFAVPFDEEPLVMLFRKIATDNASAADVFISNSMLRTLYKRMFPNGADLGTSQSILKKIDQISGNLYKESGIHIITGESRREKPFKFDGEYFGSTSSNPVRGFTIDIRHKKGAEKSKM